MKYLKGFNDELITESINTSKFDGLLKKIKEDLGVNFYFITTFGTAIPALFPIVEKLTNNSNIGYLTHEQIVLLTVFGCAELLNIVGEDFKKLKEKIKDDGLSEVAKNVTLSLDNILFLFQKISKYFGKTIESFSNMLAYTAMMVPFTLLLLDLINNGVDFWQLSEIVNNPQGAIISLGIGLTTITLKHLIKLFVNKIK